jgi:hypothetical protein
MVLRRMLGPSLETGTVLDIALSGNYCAIAIRVSVMAVQEKCDDKGLKDAFGHRSLRVGSCAGPLLEKREKGRTPG